MEIKALVKEYLAVLKSEGKSQNTIRNYEKHLAKFLDFSRKNGIHDLSTWNGKETRAFRTWLLDKGLKATTVNTILSCLSGFFTWAVDEGYMKGNPITSRSYIKAPKMTPRFLSDSELRALERIFEALPSHISLIFKTQLATGLRISEAVNLTSEDVLEIDGGIFVRVLGKGLKERLVPVMDPSVGKELLRLKVERSGRLFDVERSTALWWAWRIKKETGVDFTTHRLRHTTATKLLNEGVTIDVVQEILGHASISTTRRYAKTSTEQIRKLAVKVK